MKSKRISEKSLSEFQKHLIQEEKSSTSIEKHMYDVRDFYTFNKLVHNKSALKTYYLFYEKLFEVFIVIHKYNVNKFCI